MKNLFLLPTKNSSRLHINYSNKLVLGDVDYTISENKQHIYIVSNELPKLDEWGINLKNNVIFKDKGFTPDEHAKNFCRKIVLTTDQDLIKDGVQEIDRGFLEWFVNNPNCEEVELQYEPNSHTHFGTGKYWEDEPIEMKKLLHLGDLIYKIIIPKQELDCPFDFTSRCTKGRCDCKPKQIVEEQTNDKQSDFVKQLELLRETRSLAIDRIKVLEENERLEAAKNYSYQTFRWPLNKQGERENIPPKQIVPTGYTKHTKTTTKHFIAGAKWQQERMFSDEEVNEIISEAWLSCEDNEGETFSQARERIFNKFKNRRNGINS